MSEMDPRPFSHMVQIRRGTCVTVPGWSGRNYGGCGAFTEVSRGRWMPGKPSGYEAAPLPLIEVMDYMDRLHKDTVRKP
jgi:hypothetical protein